MARIDQLQVMEVPADHPDLGAALSGASLPCDDLGEPGRRFFAFRNADGQTIGFAGYEAAGEDVLLRSLVIAEKARGHGYGRQVTRWLLGHLQGQGRRRAYFLTLSPAAAAIGETCGFRRIDRGEAPAGIRASRQFSSLCPASAILMVREEPD